MPSLYSTHCSRSYHQLPIDMYSGFFTIIQHGILDNATVFTDPPFTQITSDLVRKTFIDKRADYVQGGKAQEPAYVAATTAFMGMLDDAADYVDDKAKGDEQIINQSGFTPTKDRSHKTASVIPVKATGVEVEDPTPTGEIHSSCDVNHGTGITYGCIIVQGRPLAAGVNVDSDGVVKIGASDTSFFINVNHQRKKVFKGLTPGIYYYIYYFMANAAGAGPLSDAKIVMCT